MFTNRIIFITGASSGLGRSLALLLAKEGANLALMSRDLKALEDTALACKTVGKAPILNQGDVTDPLHCQKAIENTIDQFGQIDHLILNAGISMWNRFDELPDLNIIKQIMETNYLGAVNCVFHALSHLKTSRGLITVISSIQGKIGAPFHTGYSASKHALAGFFDSLRLEMNNQVEILMVCPSWIKGTALKKRAFYNKNSDKHPSTETLAKHKKAGIDLDICTKKIISAMHARKRELIIPKKYQWIPLLKFLSPKWLDKIILAKIE